MLDVHPAHHAASTWRDFFIHIATICIGLLIAIGLEQTVEAIHNRHVRHQLLEDIHDELVSNRQKNRQTLESLAGLRLYFLDLKNVLVARQAGKDVALDPALDALRHLEFVSSLISSWQSAKESGHAALLSSEQIRLYNRYDIGFTYRAQDLIAFEQALDALQGFEQRFNDSSIPLLFSIGKASSSTPDLRSMSKPQLAEYTALVATAIQQTDHIVVRTRLVDAENDALLDGASTEDQMVKGIILHMQHMQSVNPSQSPALSNQ